MLYSFLKNKGNIYAKEEAYKFLTKESLGKEKNFESIKFFERYTHIVDSIRRNTNSEMMAKSKDCMIIKSRKKESPEYQKRKMNSNFCLLLQLFFTLSYNFCLFINQ